MGNDYHDLCQEIENGGYWEHSLIKNMIEGYLKVTVGDAMGTFKYQMNVLLAQCTLALRKSVFLSSSRQSALFSNENLSYKSVICSATATYHELKDENKWEPAQLPKDRLALTLTHQSKENSKHCTNKHNKGKKGDKKEYDCTGWRYQAPKSGEATTKQVNGDTFHFCSKCKEGKGFWTKSHTTATHGQGNGKLEQSAKFAVVDPNFWVALPQQVDLPFHVRDKQGRWTGLPPSQE